jgi:hypothetical protein
MTRHPHVWQHIGHSTLHHWYRCNRCQGEISWNMEHNSITKHNDLIVQIEEHEQPITDDDAKDLITATYNHDKWSLRIRRKTR